MTDIEIRQPVPLRTLHGIEMAAIGTWKAKTGETTFTTEDFAEAVAAMECPGVRNPVIKLGHDEDDAESGIRWDGEPAVGWVANMRFDGQKLIGDFTGMPAWLVDADEAGLAVIAAAYPDRSIEIYRPFLCQVGHLHPSVVTAISLLGVAPPGVGVLKSMQDVYAAFTTLPEGEPAKAGGPWANGDTFVIQTSITLAAAEVPEHRALTDIEQRSGVDFSTLRAAWGRELAALVEQWDEISESQRDELAAQIAESVDEDPAGLGAMAVGSTAAAALILSAMVLVAQAAADDQVTAAGKQGVKLAAREIADADVAGVATAVAASMADSTSSAAARMAAQLIGSGPGRDIADEVLAQLSGLSDRFLTDQLGGALSAAQMIGRHKALEDFGGPTEWYASEVDDTSACTACAEIDGTHFDTEAEALAAYGSGKFGGCLAGPRCRGQLIAVLDQTKAAASGPAVSTTIRMTLGGPMPTGTGGAVKASVSVEDISRKYYESAGYSMYITAMHVDPLELIAADDSNGKFYRIPVELSGEEFTFGEPQEVAVAYQDVKTAAAALPVRFADRKASYAAAGKNEDGTDLVAKDVTPAGAAIRKAIEKTAAEAVPTVLETEVETTQTPDADPATGPTNPKEASVDAAKMREALGLGPDATDAEVAEAFTAQVSASAPAARPPSAEAIDAMATLASSGQAVLVDKAQLAGLVDAARKGEIAYNQNRRNERDGFLKQAVIEGRIPVASLSAYEKLWDTDPEGTRKTVSLLARNIIPTSAAGFAGQPADLNEADMAYEAMYGKGA
jgi:hypothetical protein